MLARSHSLAWAGGQGQLTQGEPAREKRQASCAALVIPMRGDAVPAPARVLFQAVHARRPPPARPRAELDLRFQAEVLRRAEHRSSRTARRSRPTSSSASGVLPAPVASTLQQVLTGVFAVGYGPLGGDLRPGGGQDGDGDAWFVGWNDKLTVAVWVCYPHGVRSMKTEFGGAPVAGGTYPALIWHDVMTAWLGIDAARHPGQTGPRTTGAPAPSTYPELQPRRRPSPPRRPPRRRPRPPRRPPRRR